jgi:hypothetical protein
MQWKSRLKRTAIACGVYGPTRRVYRHLFSREGLRQFRCEVAFYKSFISPQDLCFDVGGNIGAKAEVFLALGARVVSFEPQPDCYRELKARCSPNRRLTAINAALGAVSGEALIYVSTNRAFRHSSRNGRRIQNRSCGFR